MNIRDVCQATAGGRIKGRLLEMKVNPGIICALSKYEYDNGLRDDKIRKYIKSIYNKNEELPFKLTHDLRKSSLGAINRLKMWICARAENEIPGTEVIFGKRFWNKNRALNKGKEENKTVKAEGKSDKLEKVEEYRKNGKKLLNDLENLKVENPDGHIEGNALEKLRTRRRSSCY